MLLDPEPVPAAAPLVPALDDPEPLQGRVALVALAANHAVLRGTPFNKTLPGSYRGCYKGWHHVLT